MRRYSKPAVVVTALGALGLAAFGSGAADAAGGADGNTGSGSPYRGTAESVSWNHGTAQVNKRIMERFTSEFLSTGDPALAREFISPDIVMHFGGHTQQGRDTYLGIVAANMKAFPDLKWTVEDMRAEGDTVAIRYTMTATHEGPLRRGRGDRQGHTRGEHGVLPPGPRQDRRGACPARHAEHPPADGRHTRRIAAERCTSPASAAAAPTPTR